MVHENNVLNQISSTPFCKEKQSTYTNTSRLLMVCDCEKIAMVVACWRNLFVHSKRKELAREWNWKLNTLEHSEWVLTVIKRKSNGSRGHGKDGRGRVDYGEKVQLTVFELCFTEADQATSSSEMGGVEIESAVAVCSPPSTSGSLSPFSSWVSAAPSALCRVSFTKPGWVCSSLRSCGVDLDCSRTSTSGK